MDFLEVSSVQGLRSQLCDLLVDSIEDGASLGFITPADAKEIGSYWDDVDSGLQEQSRRLFIAIEAQRVVATVQLSLCGKANGRHRGEVEKLMVHTQARGQGIAKRLMAVMEKQAHQLGISLLVLDTRLGDIASTLYRNIGYIEAGSIPQFARSSNGELEATVYFYKLV